MSKPDVSIPGEQPPTDLVIDDITVGDGKVAASGNIVEVHYVGVAWSTNRQFDASWDRGETFDFRLGAGQVIRGWDEGVAGMKVGGRRRLTARMTLDYRAAAGPGEWLQVYLDRTEEDGRKTLVHARLMSGERRVAEAAILFVDAPAAR